MALGLSQQQLADAVGTTRAAISQWENPHKAPANLKPHHVMSLSRVLKKPPSTFQRFSGDTVTPASDSKHAIPLLAWQDLVHLRRGGADGMLKELTRPAFIEVSTDIPARCLGFTINDDSMEPEFHSPEEVIIDPALMPEDQHDFVLVRLHTGELLFRRYRPRGDGAYDLVAENPDWDTHSVSPRKPAEILGTMVEHRKRRRR